MFPADSGPWCAALLSFPYAVVDPPAVPIDGELPLLVAHRLAAKALAYAKAAGVVLGEAPERALRRGELAAAALTAKARAGGRQAIEALAAAHVPAVVVKGPGIAAHYGDTRWRPYSDLDLLVRRRDFGMAMRVLGRHGWDTDRLPYPRGWFAGLCREGTNLDRFGADHVDLHHTIPPWIWGRRIDYDASSAHRVDVTVGGDTFRCLSAVDNLLVAALHVASDRSAPGRTLMVWHDLVALAYAVTPQDAAIRADEFEVTGWLREVLLALPEPGAPAALLEALPDRPVPHRRRLAILLDAERVGRRPTQEWLVRLPLRHAVAYLAGVLMPSRRFLAERPDGPVGYVDWWRELARPRP